MSLHRRTVNCRREVRPVRDVTAWQQWRFEPAGEFSRRKMIAGEEYFFDFGEQLVGSPSLTFDCGEFVDYDAPVRLRLRFGELPAETVLGLENFTGTLSRAWYQEEFLIVDLLHGSVTLPRHYAFRYLAIRVEGEPAVLPDRALSGTHDGGGGVPPGDDCGSGAGADRPGCGQNA